MGGGSIQVLGFKRRQCCHKKKKEVPSSAFVFRHGFKQRVLSRGEGAKDVCHLGKGIYNYEKSHEG